MKANSKRSRGSNSRNASTSQNNSSKAHNLCERHAFTPQEIENLRQQLLDWYDVNKRDLPWRRLGAQEKDRNRRGYAVWVSEVMLQQTQVATVIEYYNKWMKRWPSLEDLAKASLEEVNEMWAGLGYYSRARRLHEGCKKVVKEMNGEMPDNAGVLLKDLPGVGKYTSAAIASIAFNEPVGLVDGNVIRVLSRLRIIGADSSSTVVVETFWKLVDELIPQDHPGDFNQAMMELGATICTPKSPQCKCCPVKDICLAYDQANNYTSRTENSLKSFFGSEKQVEDCPSDSLRDIEDVVANDCQLCLPNDSRYDSKLGVCNYPRKAKLKEARQEKVVVCVLECAAGDDMLLFLVKRPSTGLLAGLWEFPNFIVDSESSNKSLISKVEEFMREQFNNLPDSVKIFFLGEVVHLFSHIHHTYIVHKIVIPESAQENMTTGQSADGRSTKWVTQLEFLETAVSTAMKKVYNLYKNNGQLKTTGVKRKRVTKNDSKKQKVLESFFIKTS
ncbi:adenine DNA glycosylase-like [Dendronephthya gigantea]|uniref:adenine DNA glycosylase-like n=1 Tax=Dendronephthya gigantea TaxID=151771 RepID=UPI00106AC28A|nr:adenine DNA glycosylase-like [Dendronephthya gigantea]